MIQVVVCCQMACTADDTKILKTTLPLQNGLKATLVQLIHTPAKVRWNYSLFAPHLIEHTFPALIPPPTPTNSQTAPRAAQHYTHGVTGICILSSLIALQQLPHTPIPDSTYLTPHFHRGTHALSAQKSRPVRHARYPPPFVH